MLPKLRNAFNKLGEEEKEKDTVVVGLRILVQISQKTSNIVVKPAAFRLTASKPGGGCCFMDNPSTDCYLKSCFLCNKKLSLDKDVYMYRGDQGFCSIECRNRQIVVDEMEELESSTKQMIASYRRNCSSDDRRETQFLLKELRQRHNKPPQTTQRIQWAIVS